MKNAFEEEKMRVRERERKNCERVSKQGKKKNLLQGRFEHTQDMTRNCVEGFCAFIE